MSGSLPPILFPTGRQRPFFSVREVESGWELRQFAGTAGHVYAQDRYWAPPLARERQRSLKPEHNPALKNVDPGLFLAEARNLAWADTPAGSLAVWFDPAASHPGGGIIASFGMFEASNDPDIAERLFDAAEMWLYQRVPGLAAIRGPMSLEPLRPPGLLVDGFDAPPAAHLPYGLPYYIEMIESAGYRPALEWQTYSLVLGEVGAGVRTKFAHPRSDPPRDPGRGNPVPTANVEIIRGAELAEHAARLAALLAAEAEPEETPPNEEPDAGASPFARMPIYPVLRNWQQEAVEEDSASLWDESPDDASSQDDASLQNDASSWSDVSDDETLLPGETGNEWGAASLMPGLADALAILSGEPASPRFGTEGRLALRWLLPRAIAAIVQRDGEDVAAALALPDASHGLRQSRGRLLPFGWLPYRIAVARATGLRALPLILHPGWREEGVTAALYAGIAGAAREQGYRTVEFGPVLANDAEGVEALLALGARRSRTYQIYQKDL
jgi:hypothetical protein